MKARLEFSKLATKDIDDIWLYIAVDNIGAADRLMEELQARFNLLARNPLLGTARPEMIDRLRQFPHNSYNIFYFPIDNGIEVHRVLHGARDSIQILNEAPAGPN
jgi:toxin ParE1/3/4